VSRYSKWGVLLVPPLPPDIPLEALLLKGGKSWTTGKNH
jgi:hypothetical protein